MTEIRKLSLTDLPTELLLHVSGFLGDDPCTIVPLLRVCKEFYLTFRQGLYANIFALVSSDDYFDDKITYEAWENGLHNRTLITSCYSLNKLTSLLLSRPDLLSLVKTFNINALNFDATERRVSDAVMRYMRHTEEDCDTDGALFEKTPHNFFLHRSSIHELRDAIFDSCLRDFYKSQDASINIHKYTEKRRTIASANELLSCGGGNKKEKEPMLMNIQPGVVNMMLFCPHGLDGFKGDIGFVECIDKSKKLIEQTGVGSMGIMNFQNMLSQSSYNRAGGDEEDLVYTTFMFYCLRGRLSR
ncbi:CYFA0S15e01552g1_1 [Cyberlindnera fabianii]|uniref:CYFA0S15e01552g1_1 n=1 Tax=Cyberlindnera fabianii TaxID=36022 RepID=A0A061B4G2_CYBFA|nr:CYFA0S15e01552g1_1 [Cyberlindnera fabianii]